MNKKLEIALTYLLKYLIGCVIYAGFIIIMIRYFFRELMVYQWDSFFLVLTPFGGLFFLWALKSMEEIELIDTDKNSEGG
ncbi:MAG: hypothetical protein ACFFD4_07820 [Candidatus Odinarchaeota archaeon]